MKTMVKALVILIAMGFFYAIPQKASAQAAVSFQVFYDDLSPYGQWIDDPDYGYVWAPNGGPGFVPYSTAGHWVYTDYGWTWVSDYPWGWATFHYGRWAYEDAYGWVWIPGEEWAPAWVAWDVCDGFYGWAPLGPRFSVGFEYGYYSVPASYWVFVSNRHFGDRDIYRYYEPREHNEDFIRRSTPINITRNSGNANYYTGPQRAEVERATGRPVSVYTVSERTSPGTSVDRNTVSIYRPAVSARASSNSHPAPAHVVASGRNTENNANRSVNQPENQNRLNNNNVNRQQPAPQPRNQPHVTRQPAPQPTQQRTQAPVERQQPIPQQRQPTNQHIQPQIQPYRGSPPHMPSNRRGR